MQYFVNESWMYTMNGITLHTKLSVACDCLPQWKKISTSCSIFAALLYQIFWHCSNEMQEKGKFL